jgi:hypothetical protein
VLRNILFLKFGDLKFVDTTASKTAALRNIFVLSPKIILDLSDRLEFINNLCIERNSPSEDLDKFLKLWLLRTRIYKELSDKRLLLNDSYPIYDIPETKYEQAELERAKSSLKISMTDVEYKNASDTDHLEIFYDHEQKLVKYLLVMRSETLLEQFFQIVETELSKKEFVEYLERRKNNLSNKISSIESLVHPHPTEIIDSFILFGLANSEQEIDEEVGQALKLKKIIQSPLFNKFPWIRKVKVVQYFNI